MHENGLIKHIIIVGLNIRQPQIIGMGFMLDIQSKYIKRKTNMKKILFVLSQLSTGGAERVISILANNFDIRGYEVHLITYVDVPNAYTLNKEILWTNFHFRQPY